MKKFRGVTSNQEQNQSTLVRDVRPLTTKFYDFIKEAEHAAVIVLLLGFLGFFIPYAANLLLLLVPVFALIAWTQKSHLPFRMPMRNEEIDYYERRANGTYGPGKGIYFLGNDVNSGAEMWFSDDDMRTHCLIFGSTGAGKTVTLVGIAYNALVQASGFIYIDGKGDNSLFSKLFSMAKFMGREDDLLLINFMTGARDIIGAQESRLSNTMNPFAAGSSSMLSNLVSSMLDSGGGGGDGDMWKGRAIAFVESLFKILVYQRDAGNIMLDADSIRNYFALDKLEAMVADKVFIRDGQFDISLEGVPNLVMQPISNYLTTLPGYVKERKGKQVSQVFEQHGYITMQLTRTFTTFADTYGHIMRTKLAEVDLKDVVLNRRILVVLLPALEKSPDELANLGKIVIASLRAMMASGLGDAVEGSYQDVITRKPTNSPTPYLCVMDEYGYYAVKGFAVVPAQARSLGFSCVFAGQDLPAFQKASKEEAASIGANTNIKICMKLEDPTDTWEFFMKSAGESYVTTVESFSAQSQGVSGSYSDTKGAKAEKRSRIDLLDLKDQGVGQAHVFFKSQIIRANMCFFDPPAVPSMRLNVFLKVDLPKDTELYTLVKSIEDYEELLAQGSLPKVNVFEDQGVSALVARVNKQLEKQGNPIDLGLNVLFDSFTDAKNQSQGEKTEEAEAQELVPEIGSEEQATEEAQKLSGKEESDDLPAQEASIGTSAVPQEDLTEESGSLKADAPISGHKASGSVEIFTKLKKGYISALPLSLSKDLQEQIKRPLVDKERCQKTFVYVCKLQSCTEAEAQKLAGECVDSIKESTLYRGPMMAHITNKEETLTRIKKLAALFSG